MHRSADKLAVFLVVLVLLLFSSPAFAEYDAQNSPSDVFCESGRTAGNNPAFGGKPISLLSGMETFAPSTDLSLGKLYPIRVTRSYNSVTSYDSPLGYGWAINYDKRLYTYPDGSVTVRRECGGKKRFTFQSPAGYVGQTGDTGTLVQNADGTFLYTDKNGESETYDLQGRLMSMADAKGNSLAFTYRATTRDFLWGLLPTNVNQGTTNIVAYDYHLSRIEEKDATGNLTGAYVELHYDTMTGRLTDLHLDALREMVNIGVGRAAGTLNDMLGARVHLSVPTIGVYLPGELALEVAKFGSGLLSVMRLDFKGTFTGNASLVFHTESAVNLIAALTGEKPGTPDMDSVKAGTLSEVGNIVINAVMGSISNMVGARIGYSVPVYLEDTVANIVRPYVESKTHTVLWARTRFTIKSLEVEGEFLLFFEVGSFDILLAAIEKPWIPTGGS